MAKIAGTYHAWRTGEGGDSSERRSGASANEGKAYVDIPGFCKSASLDEIRGHDYVLTPGRYVGLGDLDEDDEPFEEKMARLTDTLYEQLGTSRGLESTIRKNLEELGYGE